MMSSVEQTDKKIRLVQQTMQDTLQEVVGEVSPHCPSLEGAVLFAQDTFHEDEAGAVAIANVPSIDQERITFQRDNILGRRVDLSASALGYTFESGSYKLEQSKMNPENHLVAGLLLPAQLGSRANAVVQFAFTKESGYPAGVQLEVLRDYWSGVKDAFTYRLHELHTYSENFPNGSMTDALDLDVPTVPNAFAISWDTTNSRETADNDYPKLRRALALRGRQFLDIIERGGGRLLQGTGDGQSFALDLPVGLIRLSREEIAVFASDKLAPLLDELAHAARQEDLIPDIRFAVDLGRIEETTLGPNGPVLFSNANVSQEKETLIAFGKNMRGILSNPSPDIS